MRVCCKLRDARPLRAGPLALTSCRLEWWQAAADEADEAAGGSAAGIEEGDGAAEGRGRAKGSTSAARLLLEAWASEEMACRNGKVADFNTVMAGCTGGNSVPYHLGAGSGSKGAAMYQIKCKRSLPRTWGGEVGGRWPLGGGLASSTARRATFRVSAGPSCWDASRARHL